MIYYMDFYDPYRLRFKIFLILNKIGNYGKTKNFIKLEMQ